MGREREEKWGGGMGRGGRNGDGGMRRWNWGEPVEGKGRGGGGMRKGEQGGGRKERVKEQYN